VAPELIQQDELFIKLYSDLAQELIFQRELLVSRCLAAGTAGILPAVEPAASRPAEKCCSAGWL